MGGLSGSTYTSFWPWPTTDCHLLSVSYRSASIQSLGDAPTILFGLHWHVAKRDDVENSSESKSVSLMSLRMYVCLLEARKEETKEREVHLHPRQTKSFWSNSNNKSQHLVSRAHASTAQTTPTQPQNPKPPPPNSSGKLHRSSSTGIGASPQNSMTLTTVST